jgi:hypothetical protein
MIRRDFITLLGGWAAEVPSAGPGGPAIMTQKEERSVSNLLRLVASKRCNGNCKLSRPPRTRRG